MRVKVKTIFFTLTWLTTVGYSTPTVSAQPEPFPYHREHYRLYSEEHKNDESTVQLVFSEVVRVPDAPWLQLHFSDYNLGGESYVTVTSVKDKNTQRHDKETLQKWKGSTAFFNGDALVVKLYVAPGDSGVFVRVEEITVGERMGNKLDAASEQTGLPGICNEDDRVSFSDLRIGRVFPARCTAFHVSNGAFISAGHCYMVDPSDFFVIQFNVPPSTCDGDPVMPPVDDSYLIDSNYGPFAASNGSGDDWVVFRIDPSWQWKEQYKQAFFRMSRDDEPSAVRITGYGSDNDPPGCTGSYNADSLTQQTDFGNFVREEERSPSDVYIEYTVDTTQGTSGGPVIDTANSITVGIHNAALLPDGCVPPDTGNRGTSFENDSLESAIQTFPGPNVTYVDKDHPAVLEDGTVFRPYDTVLEAVNAALPGGIVSIVKGSYAEAITLSKPMTLIAPVGVATIGD